MAPGGHDGRTFRPCYVMPRRPLLPDPLAQPSSLPSLSMFKESRFLTPFSQGSCPICATRVLGGGGNFPWPLLCPYLLVFAFSTLAGVIMGPLARGENAILIFSPGLIGVVGLSSDPGAFPVPGAGFARWVGARSKSAPAPMSRLPILWDFLSSWRRDPWAGEASPLTSAGLRPRALGYYGG